MTYEFKFNRETWDLQLLNRGSYYYDGGFSGGTLTTFTDTADGHPILGLLTAGGDKLAAGGDPTFEQFLVRQERSFSLLNIPNDLNVF